MRFHHSLALCALSVLTLSGCQTVEQGINKDVEFISEPAGALVSISVDQATCKTPCVIAVGSKQSFKATFRLDGYKEAVVDVVSRSSDNSGAILVGSAILSGVGGVVSAKMHGLDVTHSPNPVKVTLERAGPEPKGAKGKQKALPKVVPPPAPKQEEEAPAETEG
ncbi:MAG: hypothetical protein CFE31_03565 [Rhizobiales bacterium PAR1]|nr:MAG: hypothetical protein CFE31_03565 [Rhizobiales bacterium PAR1]